MDCVESDVKQLKLRKATMQDCEVIHSWRNSAIVREGCTDNKQISLADHTAWFKSAIKDPNRIILLASQNQVAIGVLRFDRLNSDTLEVSIFLDPKQIGKGFGEKLLEIGEHWLQKQHIAVKRLSATILDNNPRSKSAFTKLDYKLFSSTYIKELNIMEQ